MVRGFGFGSNKLHRKSEIGNRSLDGFLNFRSSLCATSASVASLRLVLAKGLFTAKAQTTERGRRENQTMKLSTVGHGLPPSCKFHMLARLISKSSSDFNRLQPNRQTNEHQIR